MYVVELQTNHTLATLIADDNYQVRFSQFSIKKSWEVSYAFYVPYDCVLKITCFRLKVIILLGQPIYFGYKTLMLKNHYSQPCAIYWFT